MDISLIFKVESIVLSDSFHRVRGQYGTKRRGMKKASQRLTRETG